MPSDFEARLKRAEVNAHHAYLHVYGDEARTQADALRESDRGALHGLALSVKDNMAVAGHRMTCGSRHLADYVAPYTATSVERLLNAGAILVGKTNLDEFGCGSSGENSAFGPTTNPRDPTRVPGGSSSGAAAALAEGSCDIALGSDTGGSVRCPAAFCGVVALKPSAGLVSRHGLADLAMTLESPAPMARTVRDVARMLEIIAGPDIHDARTQNAHAASYVEAVEEMGRNGTRVGVVREFMENADDEVRHAIDAALDTWRAAGASVTEVSIPSVEHALPVYYLRNYGQFASAMQRLDGMRYGTRGEARSVEDSQTLARATLGPEVKRRILLGTYITSRAEKAKWYDRAAAAQTRLRAEFARALEHQDVLVGPTMPFTAFRLGERITDPRALYASDVLTVTANLVGAPAGSVPIRAPGLPVGMQVLGAHGDDATVLRAMATIERLARVPA